MAARSHPAWHHNKLSSNSKRSACNKYTSVREYAERNAALKDSISSHYQSICHWDKPLRNLVPTARQPWTLTQANTFELNHKWQKQKSLPHPIPSGCWWQNWSALRCKHFCLHSSNGSNTRKQINRLVWKPNSDGHQLGSMKILSTLHK